MSRRILRMGTGYFDRSTGPEPPAGERRVTLVLTVGSEPISGRIEGGEPFTGWVQLAAALDALVEDHGDEAPARVVPPPL